MNQKCEYVHEAQTLNKYLDIFKAWCAGFYFTLDVTPKLLRKSSSNSFFKKKKNSVQTVYIWLETEG